MRRSISLALAATVAACSLAAQERPAAATTRTDSATPVVAAQPTRAPVRDSIALGGRRIAAGTIEKGDVAVAVGDLDVYGTIEGDAIALIGDVIVHRGGHVTGNALAAAGEVKLDGGVVDGEMRSLISLSGRFGASPAPARTTEALSPAMATQRAVSLSLSWFVILLLIGIGVLVFAGDYLDGVSDALQVGFGRSLLVGLGAQLALLPALVLLIVGLAITIVGALLIPFAIVAYTLAAAGLLTLGFLAAARSTGDALTRAAKRPMTARGAELRSMVIGVVVYLAIWVSAALLTWAPFAGGLARAIAFVVTWVAVTTGLGATILSRGGTKRVEPEAQTATPVDTMTWQTPTPVGGVVAARRPTPASTRTTAGS